MSTDLEKLVSSLHDDSLRDYEIVKLLQQQGGSWPLRERIEVCYAVLTADSYPPRMGALSIARKLISGSDLAEAEVWSRMWETLEDFSFPQLASWICAYYGIGFSEVMFERFKKLAGKAKHSLDRLLIGMMFLTWKLGSGEAGRVEDFVRQLIASESGNLDSDEEIQMADRISYLLEERKQKVGEEIPSDPTLFLGRS